MANQIDVRARLVAVVLPDEEHLTIGTVAALLGIDYETVHRAIDRGELPQPAQVTRNRWRFLRADLRAAQVAAVGDS